MKIVLSTTDTAVDATLEDNPTARDFYNQLPLTLTLEDYAGTEKIATLNGKLSTTMAPSGYKASAGDITYYAPWGNLAIFYKNFNFATGLINLGKLHGDIAMLQGKGKLTVTISAK